MTGICGLFSAHEGGVASRVETMLTSMKQRGAIGITIERVLEENSRVGVGICSASESTSRPVRSEEANGSFVVLDGAFFARSAGRVVDPLDFNSLPSAFRIPGAFSFLGFHNGQLIGGRDSLGQKPLYWGTDDRGNVAYASLKVALKSVGVVGPKPVPSGQLVKVSRQGPIVFPGNESTKPRQLEVSEAGALARLEELLLEAVREMVPEGAAMAFSGGLDSAIVTAACKRVGLEPKLITVGLAGQPELEHAVLAARSLGFETTLRELSSGEVVDALVDVVRIVETDSPVTVGISLPFYFACKKAVEVGAKVMVAGQFSDELFGGYARFEELALKQGPEAADSAMWDSVLAASSGDFEPGDKVAVSFGLELRCPFAYLPFVEYSLELPVDLKVKLVGDKVSRKYILRRLAEKWGLPSNIVNRPKRAFQYSSGVQKVLKKEARRRKETLGDLLSSLAN